MKVLIVGGHGTIGKTVVRGLNNKHEITIGGRKSGDVIVDIADTQSITKMFETTGNVDAVVCIAGEAKWAPFNDLSEEDYYIGIRSKLMGQINLVRIGKDYLNPNGSFTLTTGILADDPVVTTTSAAMMNGGVNSFVKAAALELKNGHRINVVSAGLVEDSAEKYRDYFPGYDPVPMSKVVNGYIRSIESRINGQIIKVSA